jgi:hypothetical protein
MIGHGGFGAFQTKKVLMDHWSSTGVSASAEFLRGVGALEFVAGLAALLTTSRIYLMAVVYWKVATELLYPVAGGAADMWEWVERGGDYIAPYALICIGLVLGGTVSTTSVATPIVRRGLRQFLRVGLACLVFTVTVNAAYVTSSVNFHRRETHFEHYGKLVEYGYDRSGWLPTGLPRSARDIREMHDLDSGAVLASFCVADTAELDHYSGELLGRAATGFAVCDPPADLAQVTSFWPKDFSTRKVGLTLVGLPSGEAFAIDPAQSRLYYWVCPDGIAPPPSHPVLRSR